MGERKRLTVFAGPNGSGKSSLKREFDAAGKALGRYINADEIKLALRDAALQKGDAPSSDELDVQAFREARALRERCLADRVDFSFETVFSHPSNLETLRAAKLIGYFVTLHFVSTENSRINVERVALRVAQGGHDIPREKVIARYRRAMGLLPEACMIVDDTVLFDNSSSRLRPVVRMFRGRDDKLSMEFRRPIPVWVQSWVDQIHPLIQARAAPKQA